MLQNLAKCDKNKHKKFQPDCFDQIFLGVLQSLRMEGSNLSEFSKFCGVSYLYEFQNEGGSNLSEFSK